MQTKFAVRPSRFGKKGSKNPSSRALFKGNDDNDDDGNEEQEKIALEPYAEGNGNGDWA